MTRFRFGMLALVLLALAAAGTAMAAGEGDTLRFAIQAEPTSMDPHFAQMLANDALASHVFGVLVRKTNAMQYAPDLATSWKPLNDTTWEFKLRQGVKFHDGSPFTAEDVVFSIKRVPNVKGSPSPRTSRVAPITEMKIVDPHTIQFVTKAPTPLLPKLLAEVYIVSSKAAQNADPEDFNKGKAAIGTGPYKFVERVPGDRIVLQRYEGYYGDKPDFAKVVFRPIKVPPARVAALLAGDVDIIDNPPANDLPRLKADPKLQVHAVEACRIIYLHFDHREPSPQVKGTGGKNPFKDRRVRQAVNSAINRETIAQRIMGGLATPASQMTSKTIFGHNPELKVDTYDPEGAKKLLAEAGYPNGFEVTLSTTNDRYINDSRVAETIAAMLARVGIKTNVDAMSQTLFFPRRSKEEFSFWMAGQGCGGGEGTHTLINEIHSPDKKRGLGSNNTGGYANAEIDRLIDEILATMDETKRETLERKAAAMVKQDASAVPLHWEHTVWAARKGVLYEGRVDQWNSALSARRAK